MGVNYWAILIAAGASFLFGGVYYGLLSKPWMAALGKSEADIKSGTPMAMLLGITIVAQLIMAWVLAGLMLHLSKSGVGMTVRNGLLTSAFCWLGFVATSLVVNHGYQGVKRMLTVIDGGHWLGVLLIQGLILGWFGLR
jgi:Protein of unknown function (DUF1761)